MYMYYTVCLIPQILENTQSHKKHVLAEKHLIAIITYSMVKGRGPSVSLAIEQIFPPVFGAIL